MNRRDTFPVLAGVLFAFSSKADASPISQGPTRIEPSHIEWVAQVLRRIEEVRPGMTRKALLETFGTEGGLSTGLQRTYVSRDCPYFKIDVTFRAIGRPDRDPDGRVTLIEDERDEIVTVSRPYLQFSVMD